MRTVHTKLWNHRSSWPFEYPVKVDEVPDYYRVVKDPMDLTSILERIDSYSSEEDFVSDVELMIFNSYDYNEVRQTGVVIIVLGEDNSHID